MIWFGWVYGISTIVGYLMLNTLYTYILNISFGFVGFYGISTFVGYLMTHPFYTYILISAIYIYICICAYMYICACIYI